MSYLFEQIKHNQVQIMNTAKDKDPINTLGYFIEKPTISLASQWENRSNAFDAGASGAVNIAAKLGDVGGAALDVIKRGTKDIGQAFRGDSNFLQESIKKIVQALAKPIDRSVPVQALQWQGSEPTQISLDVIFVNPNGAPVYAEPPRDGKRDEGGSGTINRLLSLVSPSYDTVHDNAELNKLGLNFSVMKGPRGYNGTKFGSTNVGDILSGKSTELTSLLLRQNGKTVLLLDKILVVRSMQIQTSEQLYHVVDDTRPAFKWIKMSIEFLTAVALPATLGEQINFVDKVSSSDKVPPVSNVNSTTSVNDLISPANANFSNSESN